ncbi:glutathione S-transferase [Blastocladiella britannica]|nr:glutathione S-transferase [Blastocladiella britannica]
MLLGSRLATTLFARPAAVVFLTSSRFLKMSTTTAANPTTTAATDATAAKPAIFNWASKDGEFRRQVSSFRDHVSTDPNAKFSAESGRYHLYVSWACPWAHRTMLVRALKGLEDCISVSVVHYMMGPEGWQFPSTETECPGATPDHLYGAKHIRELYFKANADYSGRFTVPVLWDKKTHTIVNNESAEIIRMFNTTFDAFASRPGITFYPPEDAVQIEALNEWIYNDINNGVYRAGFATSQDAYERAVVPLFAAIDRVEAVLANSKGPWLCGADLTEADIRLWTTIVRFDAVYHTHFKCNLKTIEDNYPHIMKWGAHLWSMPGVKETLNMEHIKRHYYESHRHINPFGIVPVNNGPNWAKYLRK